MNLIDHYLPAFQFSERHACAITADAATILDAVESYRPDHDRLFRFLIGVRELPMRLASREARHRPTFGFHDFTRLDRSADEIVYGLCGAFWQADFGLQTIATPQSFREAPTPGCAKLALGFRLQPDAQGRHSLITETRVFCPDAATRRKFAPYWYLIRPISGLIRRRILASIKAASEHAAPGA